MCVEPGVHCVESSVEAVEPGIMCVEPGIHCVESSVEAVEPGIMCVEPGIMSQLRCQNLLKLGVMSHCFGLKIEDRVTDLADVFFQAVDPGVRICHVVTVVPAADSSGRANSAA